MAKAKINLQDTFNLDSGKGDHEPIRPKDLKTGVMGSLEFIVRDKHGNIVRRWQEPNIVKIFAKEMLSHRITSSQIWDPYAGSGAGAWVDSGIDPTEEFSARYILFGASFDSNGVPIENDPRYYTLDPVTGQYVPIRLGPGAEYNGGLINGVPITEPLRPLKRVESINFQPTYQPAGIPLLQPDVRAENNIVQLQTTLQLDEYNGFGLTNSDYFVITEVALAGGKLFNQVGSCDLTPTDLFLEGSSSPSAGGAALMCSASGTDVIVIDPTEPNPNLIGPGDQIKIVNAGDSSGEETLNQVSPYYLVLNKVVGGRDVTLDRVPVDVNNNPITGPIGVYRDTLRIFSSRILTVPFKKSVDFEVTCVWSLIMN